MASVKQELLDSMDAAAGSTTYGVVAAGLSASMVPTVGAAVDSQLSMGTDATRGFDTLQDTQSLEARKVLCVESFGLMSN